MLGGAPAPPRAALEAERKLKRRVAALSTRLSERTKELENSKTAEAAAVSAVQALQREKQGLERQVATLRAKLKSMDNEAASVLAEIEPIQTLKDRVFELEEEVAALRLQLDGENAAELRRLKAELEAAKAQATICEDDARDLRRRLRGDVRSSEERFLADADNREQVVSLKQQQASLEATVMVKDAQILELRFEVESERQASDRLRRRLKEVVAMGGRGGVGATAADIAADVEKPPKLLSSRKGERG